MDKSIATAAPYFDAGEAGRELLSFLEAQKGQAHEARPAVLDKLKQLLRDARTQAALQLAADGKGRRCAEGLSAFQDALIRLVYDYTVSNVYRATNPSNAERMAIIATGGYGRGMLAPFSDVDLLFLLPYKQTPWGESVVEYMLYLLWDLGLKVGHATRTVEQSLKLARTDIDHPHGSARCALDPGRSVAVRGADAAVPARGRERDGPPVRRGQACRARRAPPPGRRVALSRRAQHQGRQGRPARPAHAALARQVPLRRRRQSGTVEARVFTAEEYTTFRRCVDFLWSVRCNLHFLAGRAEERLTFDVQTAMAERLGYVQRRGLRAVERFMKHYFLVAKDVGDLTTILCSALEIEQVKPSPGLTQLLNPLSWRTRRRIRASSDFRIDNGRLNIANADVFKRDPVNLIRFSPRPSRPAPSFIRTRCGCCAVRCGSSTTSCETMRRPTASFSTCCAPDKNPGSRPAAHERGRRARPLRPELRQGRVDDAIQHVPPLHGGRAPDPHRRHAVRHRARHGGEPHPLSTSIIKTIQHRRRLYVATFLHDIAKGRTEDHSKVGAQIARTLCPRFGMSAAETETVAWLGRASPADERHRRSAATIADPSTIRDFADVVQAPSGSSCC
jgi:[protein-PII] uridylyltransferase